MYPLTKDRRYLIRFGLESSIGGNGNELEHMLHIEGVVLYHSSDSGEGVICGRLRAYVLNAEEMLDVDCFDQDAWEEEEELDEVAAAVYSKSGDWSDAVKSLWNSIKSHNVMVIEDIFLEKDHRGVGIGLAIAERTISIFGKSCGLAVISPWPTEIANRGDEAEAQIAHEKIGKYSQRIGFINIPDTDLWARSLEETADRYCN